MTLSEKIFHITSEQEFNAVALEMFQFQYQNNKLYQQYCDLIKVNMEEVEKVSQIPFLPISFFNSLNLNTKLSIASASELNWILLDIVSN